MAQRSLLKLQCSQEYELRILEIGTIQLLFLGTPSHQEAKRAELLKIDMHVQYFVQQLLGGSCREKANCIH